MAKKSIIHVHVYVFVNIYIISVYPIEIVMVIGALHTYMDSSMSYFQNVINYFSMSIYYNISILC